MDEECCVIAGEDIPCGVISRAVSLDISLERLLERRYPRTVHKAEFRNGFLRLVRSGILDLNQDSQMSRIMRLAGDVHEQNVSLIKTSSMHYVMQTTKFIRKGEELKFWFNLQVCCDLQIPVLSPSQILSHECYMCLDCEQSFKQPNLLKVHLRVECTKISDRSSQSEESLTMISKEDHDEEEEDEDEINSSTEVREENGKKGHVCMFCGKIYSRRYGLKIHVRTHTGYKPLQCRFCKRPFSDPSNLNKHVRLHAELDSPYRCHICNKALVRKRDLERHVKTKHCPTQTQALSLTIRAD